MAGDDTALLLSAVESFTDVVLDKEMSTRLLHLACRHDAVECLRLLLDGGHGITASLVDARDQLKRPLLHIAAETHSARCIQLLLSRNACTDLMVVDGRPLIALDVALMSGSAHVDWSLDDSLEDLLPYLLQKDLKAVRLLAEKTREVGEVAYRYAMEGHVAALAMLLLVAENKISATVSVVIDGVRTKRSIYNSIVDEVLSIGDASAREGNEKRKALLCEIRLLNQFGASSWNDDRRSLPPLLRAAKAGDICVMETLLMGDVDVNETDPEGNTAIYWCLSSSSSTQELRIVWFLLKSGARVFQANKLGLTPVHSAAAKGNYKALQSPEPTVSNISEEFLDSVTRLNYLNTVSLEKNHAMKRKRHKDLLDDDCSHSHEDNADQSNTTPKSHNAPARCPTAAHSAAAKHSAEVQQELCTLSVNSPVGMLSVTIGLSKTVLENDKKLWSYGLASNCILEMYVRFLGGQPPAAKKQKVEPRLTNYNVPLVEFAFPDKTRPLPALVLTSRIPSSFDDKVMEDCDDLSFTGRQIGKGLVAEFKRTRDLRKTWNGNIGLRDFNVKDGGQVVLNKQPRFPRDDQVWKDEWAKDCEAEAKIFKAIFMRDGKATPYMEHLVSELEKVEPRFGWSDWFQLFQTTNLAFKPSHRRLHASQDIWGYFQKLKTQEEREAFEFVIQKVKVPDSWLEDKDLRKGSIFGHTFKNYLKKKKTYPKTALGCLLFTRNYGTHGKYLDWLLTEVPIPRAFKGFMSEVIKQLLKSGHNVDAVLSDE
ncbi:hypothetical protein ACQ4PT_061110 [Festuca glaucescens]